MKIKYLLSAMIVFAASFVWAQNTECSGTLTANDAVDGGDAFVNGYNYNITTSGSDVTVTYELLDTQVGLVGFFQTLNPTFVETFVLPDAGTQVMTVTYTGFATGDVFTVRPKFAFAGGFSTGEYQTYMVGEDCGVITLSQVDLPVTFDDATTDYDLGDFGGNATSLVVDPADASNMVAQSIRTAGALSFAGTTVGASMGLANPIPFDAANTGMSVRVYSPAAGVTVKLKVENGDGSQFVESDQVTTVANAWETLTYDLANEATAGVINLGTSYTKAIVFFNFGLDGGPEEIYLWDDLQFAPGVGGVGQIDLPVDFEDPMLDYGIVDFGGAASSFTTDPNDMSNTVVQTIRTAGALLFAGTTVGQPLGLENPIPFDFNNTQMSVRVWSPAAGVIVKLKVEQVGNGGVFVESDVPTTTAGGWETLVFDFANPSAGTLNLAEVYNLASIFFNFGLEMGPEETYLWDDLQFAPGGGFTAIALPITFDDPAVTIGLGDFGGAVSSVTTDPDDVTNNVAQTIRTAGSVLFAGTVAPSQSLTTPIPFDAMNTTLSMRVYAPKSGVEVRLKVEDASGAISSETFVTNTLVNQWETLEFDLTNSVTAPLDFGVDYVKVVVFFDFGLEGSPVDDTYLWDDIQMAVDGPAPCENPYPQVDFASLNAQVLPSGALEFSWDPIDGQIGCQINIVVGAGPQQASIIRGGANASNFVAGAGQLVPFTTYNFRVRCGCSQSPLIAGAFTDFQSVLYIPPSNSVDNGIAYSEDVLPSLGDDQQWNNASMVNETVGQLFAMENEKAWVNVSPNPAQDNVNLSYNSLNEGQGLIQVFDAQGKLAMERVITFNKGLNRVNLNMNNLENGIYLVEVLKGNSRESVRLLMK